MYQYEYVSVEEKFIKNPCFWNYKEIINEYAEKGWRYVGFVPSAQTREGRIYQIDLVFEKKVEE